MVHSSTIKIDKGTLMKSDGMPTTTWQNIVDESLSAHHSCGFRCEDMAFHQRVLHVYAS